MVFSKRTFWMLWVEGEAKEPSAVPGYRCEGFMLKNLVVTQDQWNSLGSTETQRKFAFMIYLFASGRCLNIRKVGKNQGWRWPMKEGNT